MKRPQAGDSVRKMAVERQNAATEQFIKAGGLAVAPLVISSFLPFPPGVEILICLGFWVRAYGFYQEGQKLLTRANQATQGAIGEEKVAEILKTLEKKGWKIEYNIRLKNWGDADVFLSSPQGNYFVIDTKSHKGGVFFDGLVLKRRFGKKVHEFSDKKDLLNAVLGQAAALKEMKGLKFVQPIICFTQANLEEINQNQKIRGVYVVSAKNLVQFLQKSD
ncbi:MAG TPA: nuclease-related domain-containing protein [Nostocaceae cyanobacterium]|nr:nuclease-related domain-containing protein [Nostocaceae cyanobacterium]